MRRSAAVSFLCIVLAGGLLLLASWAAAEKPGGKLSSRLHDLARSSSLRSSNAEIQASALHLPAHGPGSLMHNSRGDILSYIRMAEITELQIQALSNAGAQIVHVSQEYGTVTAYLNPSSLSLLASLPAVSYIREVHAPQTSRAESPLPAEVYAPLVTCPQGAAVSEGDTQLTAATARSTYGLTGDGVQVGVLSDSYDGNGSPMPATNAGDDVASGDLPGTMNPCGYTTPVNVIEDFIDPAATDEGRGMLQIVHDLAPGATLSFASAWSGLLSFASNIQALRTEGADIIVDDISYFDEPFFQEGPVNVAISAVVSSGAMYFTSAGNSNKIVGGLNASSYEAPAYRPTPCPAVLLAAPYLEKDCHNFEPNPSLPPNNGSGITLAYNGYIRPIFQWNEPWYGVTNDLDIFLLDDSDAVVARSWADSIADNEPYEYFSFQNTGLFPKNYRIVIGRYSGSSLPRLKYLFSRSGGINSLQYSTSNGGDIVGPTIYGHSAAHDGLSVAAVPFSDSNNPESYTSRGTATHYYGPVSGTTPASPITPDVLEQPDFAATDGGCTTFFYSFSGGCYRFYGTSAAAPHAAAVAALLKQEANALRDDLDQGIVKYLLQSTTRMVSGGDVLSVGSGLIDASAAAAKLSAGDHYPVARYTSGGSFTSTYSSLQAGYDAAASDESLRVRAAYIGGNIDFSSVRNITVSGGYDAGFSTYSGMSTLHGIMTVSGTGTVTVEYLELI